MRDSRHGLNTQFPLPDLLRQSIYSRLAGYEDLNDAARLSTDPTFRLIGSPKRWDRSAALTSTLHWFETELLTREENLVGLMAVNRDVIGRAETCCVRATSPARTTGRSYASPRSTASTASGRRVAFRADAAFARPEIYEALEARGVTPSASPPTTTWSWRSRTSCFRSPDRPSRTRPVQELPLSGGQLDHASTRRSQSRAPRCRAVPARRLHRDQSPGPESRGRAVLQQARHRGTVDQGRQPGNALDASVVPPLPAQRGPAATERPRVQPRESLAAAGAAGANRLLIAQQSPAAPGQDGWAAGETCSVLLVPAGGAPSDAAAVRVDAPTDLGAGRANRLTSVRYRRLRAKRGRKAGEVSVRMSGAACRASQFGPPNWCFRCEIDTAAIATGTRSVRCRRRPINGRQIGNVGLNVSARPMFPGRASFPGSCGT